MSGHASSDLLACHECDFLQRNPARRAGLGARPGDEVCCVRCGARLHRLSAMPAGRALALVLAAWIVFLVANAFPIALLQTQGQRNDATLLQAVAILWQQDMGLVAILVALTTVALPGLELLVLTLLLLRAIRGAPPRLDRYLPGLARIMLQVRPWNMVEVLLLGILVSLVKLSHLADLTPGLALWAFAALMVLLASLAFAVNMHEVWSSFARPDAAQPAPPGAATGPSALAHGWRVCTVCGQMEERSAAKPRHSCARCGALVVDRRGTVGAWALLLASAVMFLPANLLPIMETGSLFGDQQDTILSGVAFLWQTGSWPLAVLVFVASILVPLFKLLALALLLISVRQGWARHRMARGRLFRLLELVGRWSMLDIYVVTLLAALVQIKSLASITVGPGAVAFGAVVVLTMLATLRFDPRLIWDDPSAEAERI